MAFIIALLIAPVAATEGDWEDIPAETGFFDPYWIAYDAQKFPSLPSKAPLLKSGGEGPQTRTVDDDGYTIITTPAGLQAIITTNPAGQYRLGNNIDLSSYSSTIDTGGWDPIGSNTVPFTGELDGSGYSITGLSIDRPTNSTMALFGFVANGAYIHDLTVSGANVIANTTAAAVVGQASKGPANTNVQLVNVTVTAADITCGTNHRAAGILAYATGSGAIVNATDCVVSESVITSQAHNAGGVVGSAGSSAIVNATRCEVANTTVTAQANFAGGVVGYAGSSARVEANECEVRDGTVTAQANNAGGVVGSAASSALRIENCNVKNESVTAQASNAGGVVGIAYSSAQVDVIGCDVETCEVASTSEAAGGVVGSAYSSAIVNVTDCVVSDTVAKTRNYAGGVVGAASSSAQSVNVTNCTVQHCTVATPGGWAGGVMGRAFVGPVVSISGCDVADAGVRAVGSNAAGIACGFA